MTPSVQLYARQQGATGPDYSQYTLIDTYESEPIKLTKSIQGLEDPEVTTSGYSQTPVPLLTASTLKLSLMLTQ